MFAGYRELFTAGNVNHLRKNYAENSAFNHSSNISADYFM